MCKKPKGLHNRVDKCIVNLIDFMKVKGGKIQPIASCCGHGKYPLTIVVTNGKINWELLSNKIIPRKRNFYKKDKDGYYFIPEVVNGKNI